MTATNEVETVIAEIVTEQTLDAQIAEMRLEIKRLTEIVDAQVTLLQEYKQHLEPTLQALNNSPVIKMLFGG